MPLNLNSQLDIVLSAGKSMENLLASAGVKLRKPGNVMFRKCLADPSSSIIISQNAAKLYKSVIDAKKDDPIIVAKPEVGEKTTECTNKGKEKESKSEEKPPNLKTSFYGAVELNPMKASIN